MPWFKVDDKLHDHRKARLAGCNAMGLWLMAGSWSAANITDGFVPVAVISRWDRQWQKLADRLLAAELWTTAEQHGEPGYQFHDWSEFQPHSDDVKADRKTLSEKRRLAGRSGAKSRWNGDGKNGKAMANGMANEWQDTWQSDGPDPTRPDPTTNGSQNLLHLRSVPRETDGVTAQIGGQS